MSKAGQRITHESLCRTEYCPAPSDPDWHYCIICKSPKIEHHHTESIGMGGSKSRKMNKQVVVPLCTEHHNQMSLNKYTDKIEDGYYTVTNKRGNVIVRKQVRDGADMEGRQVEPLIRPSRLSRDDGNGAEVLSETESADRDSGEANDDDVVVPGESLTFAEWAEKCKSIGAFRHSLGFLIGDLVILGEDNFGEKAWQELSELGYEDRSIGNMVRVCRAIPPERRRDTLTYSHHVVVYKLPETEQDTWLDQAAGLTAKAFRELVHGPPKPRVKRYTIEQLRARSIEADAPITIPNFLDWLEAQGE